MVTLPLDVGTQIRAVGELAELLPAEVRIVADPELLSDVPTAAALRVLATIHDPRWHRFVTADGIDWTSMLRWSRSAPRCRSYSDRPDGWMSNSQRVLLEIAASLAGHPGAHVVLLYAVRVLSRHHFLAVMDALRIAVEGLEP
jgi:hypothetical protein